MEEEASEGRDGQRRGQSGVQPPALNFPVVLLPPTPPFSLPLSEKNRKPTPNEPAPAPDAARGPGGIAGYDVPEKEQARAYAQFCGVVGGVVVGGG